MNFNNEISVTLDANTINEGIARVIAVSFTSPLNPTIDVVNDIRTAVSEAVTNAIIHGYEGREGKIFMNLRLKNSLLYIEIKDNGMRLSRKSCAARPREGWRHAVSKFRRAVSVKITIEDRK